MIDLTPFYDPDEIREAIAAPLSDAEHTYASNGHILIRVPRRPDVAESKFSERFVKLLDKAAASNPQWFEIPALPDAIMEDDFDFDEDENGNEIKTSSGMVEQMQSVDVGDCFYARKYLAMIAALPNAKISPNGPTDAAWFKFDGGDGLLMPMRERTA